MKTIGIVGGIAWPSSLVYYKAINEYFKDHTQSNGLHTPNLILAQTDFALIEEAQSKGNWDEVGRLLAGEAAKLKAAGADFFLLACNTVHTADEYIIKNSELPMLHIVDATADKVVQRGYKTVGLLGSRYTMTGTYFVGRLRKKYNLKVLVAEGVHENNVHNALYQELAKNMFLPETRAKFKAAMEDLIVRGAEVIVLGCTEFGILVKQEDSTVPIIDTSYAHAEAAVNLALANN
ncbi:Aspartate racemase [Penicillium angulare]|uniref:Aspartate racemase n=1 Tax=Penicillium angulare TaxID=116970 RepID=A0A9W9K5Y5_9EURO|nr:Aspartate racemase [Penicillium angulare]